MSVVGIITVESWDDISTATAASKDWSISTSTIVAGVGRRGTSALRMLSGGPFDEARKVLNASTSACVLGFSANTFGGLNGDQIFLEFIETGASTSRHVTISYDVVSRVFKAWRDLGVFLLATSVVVDIVNSGYHYIEVKVKIHDTLGTVDIRVDGTSVLSVSNVDTRVGQTGVIHAFAFRGGIGTGEGLSQDIDDIYFLDATGGTPNDFLGDCRVDLLLPNAVGSNTQFTPNPAVDNYLNCDEVPHDSLTTYNYSTTVNHIDTYNMQDLSITGATIHGVYTSVWAAKDDAGTRRLAAVVKSGVTTSVGADVGLGTSFKYVTKVDNVDPNTGVAWTEAGVNAMECGAKVTV